jgi:hypothetical protein
MFGSPFAGSVHTSGTLPERSSRAATEHAEPGRVVALATKAQRVAGGRAIADGKRAIVPDLRELARSVGGAIDVELVLELIAKRGPAVGAARTPAIGREHDWTGRAG